MQLTIEGRNDSVSAGALSSPTFIFGEHKKPLLTGVGVRMTIIDRSEEAARLLLANAIDFLNGGIVLLFSKGGTGRDAKLAVISIQTAVELFAKYRIVRELGFAEIIRKGAVPQGGDLLKSAALGHFSTLGYDGCLERIGEFEWIGEWQRELIGKLQKSRNTLVHFAGDLDVEETQNTVAALLVQVLALFAAGQSRDEPIMQTYRHFLEADNFETLTNHSEFLVEAFDAASADLDAEEILTCWECRQVTLTRRPLDAYFCWTCGLTAQVDAVGFAPCWQCLQPKMVVYDRLNETNGTHFGRCLSCGSTAYVGLCAFCCNIRSESASELVSACSCGSEISRNEV